MSGVGPGRRMFHLRRLASSVLVIGLILASGTVFGPAGARDGFVDPRIVAARGAIADLRRGLDLATGTISGLQQQVGRVRGDLAALSDRIEPADASLQSRERTLKRRVTLADAVVTAGRIVGRPASPALVGDLSAPLEIVSHAIHSSDELAVELLKQQDDAERQALATRQLQTNLRQMEFEIATQVRNMRTRLTEATRSAHALAEAGASPALQQRAAGLLEEARTQLHVLQIQQTELRQAASEALQASVGLADRQRELKGKMREAKRAVEALYQDMAAAESLVAARMVMSYGPVDWSTPPVVKGVLHVCPVDPPRAYSDDFGAPRWAGGFHLHQGNDIFAPLGTPIRAPFDGTVVVADNTLGGMAVKVYSETGYVYNAHLSAYGQLGPVTAGTIIGYVGNSGDAINSPPHDHFELHPGNGPAIDPFPYLNAVC